jgi:hypothetical protein
MEWGLRVSFFLLQYRQQAERLCQDFTSWRQVLNATACVRAYFTTLFDKMQTNGFSCSSSATP